MEEPVRSILQACPKFENAAKRKIAKTLKNAKLKAKHGFYVWRLVVFFGCATEALEMVGVLPRLLRTDGARLATILRKWLSVGYAEAAF